MAVRLPVAESENEPFAGETQLRRDGIGDGIQCTSAGACSTPKRNPVRFLQRFAFI
jgi:hypothetical protein